MSYFNFNGKFYQNVEPVISADNRSLRYGDGIFETIKYKNNNLILADEHFHRLWKGLQLLQFDIPKLFTPEKLSEEIFKTIHKNKNKNARVRLGIYRGSGGLYDIKNHTPNFIIETWPLPDENGHLNTNGLDLCIYKDAIKSCDAFSNIKHNNYLPYFMGAIFAKKNLCNDALILNNHQRICDSTIANVFIIKDETIYTPSLQEGCVAGIMRKFVIDQLKTLNFSVSETKIEEAALMNADEIFLTNSIYNMRWVGSLGDKKFSNIIIQKIALSLQQKNATIFC
jgi:branched-chain amino acid aminotransferase